MAVVDGQPVNAATNNSANMSRTTNTSTTGVVALNNASPASGASISNAQQAINETFDAVGVSGVGDTGRKLYASNEVLVDGESHKQGLEKLDAKFSNTLGHAHSGAAGDGAPISAATLGDFNNYWCEYQTFTFDSASGSSTDVSSALTGKTAGGAVSASGVVTSAPNNKVEIVTKDSFTAIEDAGGQRVYGRLTGTGSSFTLTYFTNEAGTETAHNLSSQNIRVIYREVFTSANRPTIPSNPAEFGTLDITGDVVDASATQRGLVSTGSQSLAGDKTFQGALIAQGSARIEEKLVFDSQVDTATGADAELSSINKTVVRLSNASLTSVNRITSASNSQVFVLVNDTGADITIKNLNGSPAGNQIITGTGADVIMKNGASCLVLRNTSSAKWTLVNLQPTQPLSPLTTKGDIYTFSTVNARLPIGSNGQILVADSTAATGLKWVNNTAQVLDSPFDSQNYTIAVSLSANAMTIALKTKAGTDPTALDPVKVAFRNSSNASGLYSVLTITSALSMTVSAGSTLGHVANRQNPIWVYLFNDAGTPRLGVSTVLKNPYIIQPATAEGGAGAADSNRVIYAPVAIAGAPVRVLARMLSIQTTAGNWATAIDRIFLNHELRERIVEKYITGSGQTVTTSGTIINFDTLSFSTHNCVTTGGSWSFTAPRSDFYTLSGILRIDTTPKRVDCFINGSHYLTCFEPANASTTNSFSNLVYMTEGQTLDLRVSGGGTANLFGDNKFNQICITNEGYFD